MPSYSLNAYLMALYLMILTILFVVFLFKCGNPLPKGTYIYDKKVKRYGRIVAYIYGWGGEIEEYSIEGDGYRWDVLIGRVRRLTWAERLIYHY